MRQNTPGGGQKGRERMKMKQMLCLVLTALLLLTAGCSHSADKTDSTTWVTYKEVSSKVQSEGGEDLFVYSYQQPVLTTSTGAAAGINNKLDNTTSAFLYGSGGVEELTEMAKMDQNETWFTCYALSRTVSVARVDDTVASFRYVDYAFTGGVHGYSAEYGVTYDMVTGEQLSLSSLTNDEQALKDVCRDYILELIETSDYGEDVFFANYESYLDSVLKNWVLTDQGLQFIAQPYVIAAYAVGTIRFTVPYEQLRTCLKAQWIPAARGYGGGTLALGSGTGDTAFVLDSDGENVVIRVNGTVYDFSVEGVNAYRSGQTDVYYMTQQHLYSPEVTSMSIQLQIPAPGAQASTMVRYCNGDGTEHQYYITQDSKLTEADPYLVRESVMTT